MTVTPIFRSVRDPVGSAARWAVVSVPAQLSARGLAVPVWAALLLPAIALLPQLPVPCCARRRTRWG